MLLVGYKAVSAVSAVVALCMPARLSPLCARVPLPPLQLPPTKWKGLKLLPTAAPSAGSEEFRQLVRGLIAMLDAELAAALPPLLPRRNSRGSGAQQLAGGESPASPPSGGRRRAVRDDLFLGLINSDSEDDSDEDWAADLEREQKLQVGGWGYARAAGVE